MRACEPPECHPAPQCPAECQDLTHDQRHQNSSYGRSLELCLPVCPQLHHHSDTGTPSLGINHFRSSVGSTTSCAAIGHAAAAALAKPDPIYPIFIIYSTSPGSGWVGAHSVTWISSCVDQRGSGCRFQHRTLGAKPWSTQPPVTSVLCCISPKPNFIPKV